MALLFADGFGHYSTSQITNKWNTNTNCTIGSSNGRFGDNALQAASSSRYVTKFITPGSDTLIFGFAFKFTTLTTSAAAQLITFRSTDDDDEMCGLYINSTGTIGLSDSSVVLAESGENFGRFTRANVWYWLEGKIVFNNTNGSVEIRHNGETIWTRTGLDTTIGGGSRPSEFRFGNVLNSFGTSDFDSFYLCDDTGTTNNDFLGDIRIETLFPDGAGTSTDWTPSTGSNYENVDDTTPDSDSTYNSSTTATDHDTYTFSDLATSAGTIAAVQLNLFARKDDGGTREVSPVIRSGGTDYDGTTFGLGAGYTYYSDILATNPDTASAWTVSEVNGAEFGVRLQT